MLSQFAQSNREDVLSRLASLPDNRLEALLIEMNVNAADLDDVKDAVLSVGGILTPEDAIHYSFSRPDIREGRFNTTSFHVLYAALEPETCLAEIAHHSDYLRTAVGPFASRYYQMLKVNFSGTVADLRGQSSPPALVSATTSGYPYCQQLGSFARMSGVDAFYTPSARRPGGTCSPIFNEASLSGPEGTDVFRFFWDGTAVAHEQL